VTKCPHTSRRALSRGDYLSLMRKEGLLIEVL